MQTKKPIGQSLVLYYYVGSALRSADGAFKNSLCVHKYTAILTPLSRTSDIGADEAIVKCINCILTTVIYQFLNS